MEEAGEGSFQHTVSVHLNVWVKNHGGGICARSKNWGGHVVWVLLKDKSLDEVTQGECAGEQRLLKDAPFPISLGTISYSSFKVSSEG